MAELSEPTTVTFPRKLLKQFILMYKELDCLWNRESPGYKVKMKRHQAITQLTQLVQSFDPTATRVHILRKIDSLRACVRREYKRVVESRRKATCEEELYKPQLWYYEIFSFLLKEDDERGKFQVRSPEQNAEELSEEDVESEDQNSDAVKHEQYETCELEYDSPSPCSKRDSPIFEEPPRRKRSRHRGSEPSAVEDEYDAIGINVAAKLRNLPENMRILAEKLIGDVLFQAQTDGLTTATVLVTPDPFH